MAISKVKRRRVFERDNYTCQYCKADLITLLPYQQTIDHVIPTSRGGSDDMDNLRTSCRDCNCRKGSEDVPPPLPPADLTKSQKNKRRKEKKKAFAMHQISRTEQRGCFFEDT